MKYNPDSYPEYPILRPHSDDYPGAEFKTNLTMLSQEEDETCFRVDFDISEPSIEDDIKHRDAKCCVHIYCGTTRYSEMVGADEGEFSVEHTISLKNVRGLVEIRPMVLTVNNVVVNTQTAHPDYRGNPMRVDRYRQRAVCEPYHFRIGVVRTVKSVFQIQKTEDLDLNRGEFEYEAELSERYIKIKMNPETYEDFQRIRGQERLTRMTVYLNALTDALGRLHEDPHDEELANANGWAPSIREHIKKLKLDVPAKHSCALAAQRLLESPLAELPYIVASMEGD